MAAKRMTVREKIALAKEKAKNDFDVIYDIWAELDFVEVVGSYNGDQRDYRYYDNGLVAER